MRGRVRVLESLCALLMALVVLSTVIQVAARELFSIALPWANEASTIAFSWVGMLGAALAYRKKTHMRVDMSSMVPARLQQPLKVIIIVAEAAFLIILVVTGADLMVTSGSARSEVLGLPDKVFIYSLLPVAGAAMLWELVYSVRADVLKRKGGD